MRVLAAAAVVVVVVAAGGCAERVIIDPPPLASASESTRRDYFDSHRSEEVERGQLVKRVRLGDERPTFTQRSLQLRNGLVVQHAQSLRPLVADDSAAAGHIDVAGAKDEEAFTIVSSGGAVIGAGILAGSTMLGLRALDIIVVPEAISDWVIEPPSATNAFGVVVHRQVWSAFVVALPIMAVGTGVAWWGSTIYDEADDARTLAFRTFDAGLWRKLGFTGDPPPRKGDDDDGRPVTATPTEPAPEDATAAAAPTATASEAAPAPTAAERGVPSSQPAGGAP